jgi:ABC-type multidrug transport system fused ATPase/permease subunit
MTLIQIIQRFRRPFILAISLVVIEKIAWIIEPTVFGRLLDALIEAIGSKEKISYAIPLLLWIGVFAVNSGAGVVRRSVDPRIYLNMFSNIAVQVTETSRAKGLESAKIAARVELSQEYVTFLQYRIPEIVEQFFDLGGSIIALSFYDMWLAVTCSCIAIPLVFMNRLYVRKVDRLQKEYHDMREDIFQTFETRSTPEIRRYYESMARPQRRIANWGALNFGVLRFFLLGIFLVVLYISIDIDNFSTGMMYSVVAYLWTFVTSTEYLPDLMESYSSIKEIQKRVRTEQLVEPNVEEV